MEAARILAAARALVAAETAVRGPNRAQIELFSILAVIRYPRVCHFLIILIERTLDIVNLGESLGKLKPNY